MWKKRIQPGEKVSLQITDVDRKLARESLSSSDSQPRPLKLTPPEREAIVHGTRIRAKLRDRIKAEPEGTAVVEFTVKELDHLLDELGTSAEYVPDSYRKRLVAVVRKINDLLDPGIPARRRPAKLVDTLFQFKITLVGSKPPIWRRVQTKDCTLADLHELIQAAMGWEDCHLHQFVIDGVRYGPPSPGALDFGLGMKDESQVRLSQLLPKTGKAFRIKYEYDFGEGWLHQILFEGYRPVEQGMKYPLCLEGARSCPPEDVGGVGGYEEFLEALADPKHERHDELLEWSGPFDPGKFDPKEATKEIRQGLRNSRG